MYTLHWPPLKIGTTKTTFPAPLVDTPGPLSLFHIHVTFENDEDYVRVLFTIFETPKIFLLSLSGTAAKGFLYFTCQNVENTFLTYSVPFWMDVQYI